MINWITRKLVKYGINRILKNIKNFPDRLNIIDMWISRLKSIIALLEVIMMKFDDQCVTDEEIKEIQAELNLTIDRFKEGK